MVETLALIGVVGMSLIILGWIPKVIATLKHKEKPVPIAMSSLYLLGSLLLTAYAFSISDYIFATLNILAAGMAAIEFYFGVSQKLGKRKKNAFFEVHEGL